MKALVCEMCASRNLVKQDGIYVCQHCGTQYTVEEAKKLMVDITGSTVKIDNSAFVEKYIQNARRAKQKEDWEETEKYYNLVEQNAPDNIEAIFYSAYGKAKSSLVESDLFKRQAAFNVLQNCVSIIDDNFNIKKEEENRKIIEQISNDIFGMACSSYVYNQKGNGHDDRAETITLFNGLGQEFMVSLEHIAQKFPENEKEKKIFYYNLELKHAEFILKNGCLANPQSWQNVIMKLHEIIHRLDSTHEIPLEAPTPPKQGCYVATAVYGSYDCPQVWTLRRYRDDTLAKTWYGRLFIHTYYAISPTLVKWFGEAKWFKNLWKPRLDSMVVKLNSYGIQNTPYEDKQW